MEHKYIGVLSIRERNEVLNWQYISQFKRLKACTIATPVVSVHYIWACHRLCPSLPIYIRSTFSTIFLHSCNLSLQFQSSILVSHLRLYCQPCQSQPHSNLSPHPHSTPWFPVFSSQPQRPTSLNTWQVDLYTIMENANQPQNTYPQMSRQIIALLFGHF
jgi:hypothetical protein